MSSPLIWFGDRAKLLTSKKIIDGLGFEDTLVVDTSGKPIPTLVLRGDPGQSILTLKNAANTTLFFQRAEAWGLWHEWSGQHQHQMYNNELYYFHGAGGKIQMPALTISGDPSLANQNRVYVGQNSYATSGTQVTSSAVQISAYSWNGSDGFTLFSDAQIRYRQATPGVNDARLDTVIDGTTRTTLKGSNFGIGTTDPQANLHAVGTVRIEDGNQASGKVLTSDASGNATWQSSAASPNVLTPVGSIIAYNPGYYGDGSNGSFTLVGPGTNDVAGVNAYLPSEWRVCDGSVLNDPSSPIWNAAGRFLPNLTGNRFLLGFTASGVAGGSNSATLVEANLPSHSHSINHDHAVVASLGASASHSHTINHDHASFTSGINATNHTHLQYVGNARGGAQIYSNADPIANWSASGASFISTGSNSANHQHSIDVPAFSGSSGSNSVGHTHNVDLPSFSGTSGLTGSGTSFSTVPQYLSTFFIVRVK